MADVTEALSFRIDNSNLCLWRRNAAGAEERLALTPKTFDVLRYLVENTGKLVTHDELLTSLWPDVHVQPEVIKSHILAIRTVLGDDSTKPRFIETQRGRGYRFVGAMDDIAPPGTRSDPTLELGVFAGRIEPLAELLALYNGAASGEPQAVFISGEPGIGKTTLINQFLSTMRSQPERAIAQGGCIEGFAGAEPYCPALEALDDLCESPHRSRVIRALLDVAPAWAVQMPAHITAEQRAALRQQLVAGRMPMVREGCLLFEAIAAENPLILVLEDLHWADFATIDLISALCRRRSAAKLMLIVTYRPEDLKTARHPLKQVAHDLALRKYCHEIALTPLSVAAIDDVLTHGADGKPVSAAFSRFIGERTGGNPLFMRVMLEHLLHRGDVARSAEGWRPLVSVDRLASEAPPTLAQAIKTKIEGLAPEQCRVLEAASVAGDQFDPVTTARAAGMDAGSFESICEEFAASIIRRDELLLLPNHELVCTYRFNHTLYRQIIYDGLGPMRRASLHRAIGERLEEIYPPNQRGDLAVRLAQHFSVAQDWPRALDYLRSALHVANGRSARRDAMAILDRAVDIVAKLDDDVRIPAEIEFLEWRAAIEAVAHDPGAQETYAQIAQKAQQHGDLDAQCRALLGLAYAVSWRDLAGSLRLVEQVLDLSARQADPIQQDLTRITAHVRRLWGNGWNRAEGHACEDAVMRLRQHGDSLATARANASFAMLCIISARYREAHDLVDEGYRALREASHNLVEIDLARISWMRHIGVPWSLVSLGEFGAALREFDAGIATFEQNDDVVTARVLQSFRCVLLLHAMDYEGVLQATAPLLDLSADPASHILPTVRRKALLFSGLAEAGLGNNAASLNHFRMAEREMAVQAVHLDWYWRLTLEWGMVNLLITDGAQVAALVRAERLCDLAAQTDERAYQALAFEARARAALACGKNAEAVESVAKALAACDGVEVPLAEWRVHATAASTYRTIGDAAAAAAHSNLSSAIRQRIAGTLPERHPLRVKFEARSEMLASA